MTDLAEYATSFTRAQLRREDGILEVTLCASPGESLVWDEPAHREFPELFSAIANDQGNRVMILTGAGREFCARGGAGGGWDVSRPAGWDKLYREGKALLRNLLDIEIPIIAAVNGPARIHAEMAVLSDIVLAAESAVFQDAAHFPRAVPADGVHVIWPLLLGPNRGRAFLLTGSELSASEALAAGVVAEVIPDAQLLNRAWELARQLSQATDLTLRYSRVVLTEPLRRAMAADLGNGLALEGLAMVDIRMK